LMIGKMQECLHAALRAIDHLAHSRKVEMKATAAKIAGAETAIFLFVRHNDFLNETTPAFPERLAVIPARLNSLLMSSTADRPQPLGLT